MRRFIALFRRRRLDRELDEELRFHLEAEAEANVRRGMTPEQARAEAHRSFGGVEQTKEAYRDRRGIPLLDTLAADLRYGARLLRKDPGFAVIAILTLALGIGATSAIFSVVNAVLLKPLPYRGSDRLALVRMQIPKFGTTEQGLPVPDAVEYSKSEVFEEAGIWLGRSYDLSGDSAPEQVIGARSSANLLPMLGAAPLEGRLFTGEEERSRAHVVILSYGLWRRRYGGDPNILGRSILLNRVPYQVIGVMPPSFVFPPRGLPEPGAALWIPLSLTPVELKTFLDNNSYAVLGRLRPGISQQRVNAAMLAIARRVQDSFPPALKAHLPADFEVRAVALPFHERVVGGSRELLFVLLGAVGFLLLIACANVANMLLSRGAARRRELDMRAALGAGRGRLIRQLLTESALLSALGGALGVLLARGGTGLLISALPANLPLIEQIRVDFRVLLFACALSIFTGLAFGLTPAFTATGSARPAHRGRLLSGLVSLQLALALVLLSGAGLLIRSFVRLQMADQGFHAEHLLTASIALPELYSEKTARAFYEKLLPRLVSLPSVISAGMSSGLPFDEHWSRIVAPEGSASDGPRIPVINYTLALGNYLQALGVPLKRGRFFSEGDTAAAPLVTIVNETLARQFWPGEDPIGKRMRWGTAQMGLPWLTVVGVVGDVNQGAPDKALNPHAYGAYLQNPGYTWLRKLNLAMRTEGDPLALANAVRAEVAKLDPELPVTKVRTMEQIFDSSLASRRLSMWVLAVFAGVALLLAAVGVYGVMAYAVSRRTREIGIRMALGARRGSVLGMIFGHGMKLVIAGVAMGVAASLALTRLIASQLYGITPADPLTYAAVVALLVGISLAAHFAPARRAASVDPALALRHE